ncbi:MAG: DUF4416 family protein [Candidatus Stahlbacteria bacterium]|nr:DUF4416 family protein [Candidatus Stahlbacteria bacterium]
MCTHPIRYNTEVIAKLICGIIFRAEDCEIEKVIVEMESLLGRIDFRSPTIPFNFTDYYTKEMGAKLKREWIGFELPIQMEALKSIKLTTIKIENKFKRPNGIRTVNIDPGYVTLHNLVLASTKNYSHRIYLGDGIFAEVTLIYKNHKFQPLAWTYSDYRANLNVFEEIRNKFKVPCLMV